MSNRTPFELAVMAKQFPHRSESDLTDTIAEWQREETGYFQRTYDDARYMCDWVEWAHWAWELQKEIVSANIYSLKRYELGGVCDSFGQDCGAEMECAADGDFIRFDDLDEAVNNDQP